MFRAEGDPGYPKSTQGSERKSRRAALINPNFPCVTDKAARIFLRPIWTLVRGAQTCDDPDSATRIHCCHLPAISESK